jgi:CRISPR-associated protein Csx10
MKQIELTITALSPLAIGRQKPGGSVSEAQNYIPGSVIRGAIASQILQQADQRGSNLSQNDNDFQSLFLDENPAIFQNAYPAIAKINKDEFDFVTEPVKVLPATAVSSKTESGFKPSGNGVFDTLIDRFCGEECNLPFDPRDLKSLQDGTDARVEPYSGFYSKSSDSKVKHKYRSHSVSTRFLTRVGINRRRATSEDDILYSIEVLNESFLKNLKLKIGEAKDWQPYIYRSSILVPDDNRAKLLAQFLSNNAEQFRLGGSASRGLGKVKIEVKPLEDLKSQVRTQIEQFNQELTKRREKWNKLFHRSQKNLSQERFYFTLDLQSDAILNENWQYTAVISEKMLSKFTNVDDSSLKLEVSYSSYDYISGWNSAWGLMKDVEVVTNKGAVYLFSSTKEKMNDWIKALEEIESNGVGARTSEGFGQVEVCNDFHFEFCEEPV